MMYDFLKHIYIHVLSDLPFLYNKTYVISINCNVNCEQCKHRLHDAQDTSDFLDVHVY